ADHARRARRKRAHRHVERSRIRRGAGASRHDRGGRLERPRRPPFVRRRLSATSAEEDHMRKNNGFRGGLSRRAMLGGAGAAAGVAIGSRAIPGFPAVHAQEPKVLRYLGTAVNQSADIAKKAKEDTGITIEYIPVTTDEVTKRVITQPNSFDLLDEEYFSLRKVIPSGNLVGMDAKRIKNADRITPIFTKGELPNGKKIGDQGTAPKKVFYLEAQNAKKFASSPTQWITLIPTVYNADTLGIRPDLIKRPIESWK